MTRFWRALVGLVLLGTPGSNAGAEPAIGREFRELAAIASSLAGRIAATAHGRDPDERAASAALVALASSTWLLASLADAPSGDPRFAARATELARAIDAVDHALAPLGAYVSIHATWREMRDRQLPEMVGRLAPAPTSGAPARAAESASTREKHRS